MLTLDVDPHRYPIDPLLDRYGGNITVLAEAIGVQARSVNRARENGGITWPTADRWACAVGLHPFAIWPDWFDNANVHVETDPDVRRREAKRLYLQRIKARSAA